MASTVIAGKPSNTVGDKDATLILRGSSVKILWGNKFIDLIKKGKINAEYKEILKTADSVNNISDDGIYLIEETVWAVIGGTKILLTEDNTTTYVSYLVEQKNITADLKNLALTNIGFYYDTLEDAKNSDLKSGIIYVLGDNKLYLVKNGTLSEYITTLPTEKLDEEPINNLYIEDNSLIVDGEKYITCEDNIVSIHKQLILENNLYSKGASANYGYKLYIENGKSYLEVDKIIERDAVFLDCYEHIKVYSNHNNVVTSASYVGDTNSIECVLQEKNNYEIGEYVYILGAVEILDSYTNGILTLTLNKISSKDIVGFVASGETITEITIPAGQSKITLSTSEDYDIEFLTEKELFEYEISNVYNLTIVIQDGDDFFLNNCKYIYVSNKPLIKIENNNLEVFDRSVLIETTIGETTLSVPDEEHHTRIGIVKEDDYETLKEPETEEEDNTESLRPQIGIYSDNLIALNPILYNTVFKTVRRDRETEYPNYPKYFKDIEIPIDESIENPNLIKLDKRFNLIVPDMEWIKWLLDLYIPLGTIIMFNGLSEIPPGWSICNGDNGTPNLIGKFIKADITVHENNPEGVDENNLIIIKENNLPEHHHPHKPHSHEMTELSGSTNESGDLTSSLKWTDYLWNLKTTTTNVISSISLGGEGSDKLLLEGGTSTVVDSVNASTLGGNAIGANHAHSITITEGEILETTSEETEKNWSNDPIKIEPRSYSLIFIMKTQSFVEYELK